MCDDDDEDEGGRLKNNRTKTPVKKCLIALIGNFIFKDPSSGNRHMDHIVDAFTSMCQALIVEYESTLAASNAGEDT